MKFCPMSPPNQNPNVSPEHIYIYIYINLYNLVDVIVSHV